MNAALWTAQGLLAAIFFSAGFMKVFAYEKNREKFQANGITEGMALFIGVCEIAGALGVILPSLTGVLPPLAGAAALGLSAIMLLAMGFHARRKEPGAALFTVFLFLVSLFVAFKRFH